MANLGAADYVVIVGYFLFVLLIGLWVSTKDSSVLLILGFPIAVLGQTGSSSSESEAKLGIVNDNNKKYEKDIVLRPTKHF